jgi:RluA family pseudouridine synthase
MIGKRLLTVAIGDPERIAPFLAARLGLDVDAVRVQLEAGAVQVNGARADFATRLTPGDRVVVRGARSPSPPPEARVVHRDDDLMVVDKPAGLLAQPSPGEAVSAERQVQAHFPSARLLHRLDRDASGLLLFSLHAGSHAALQQQLERGAVARSYLAVAAGRVDGPREIRLRIARDPHDARRRVALPENAPGGRPACTRIADARPIEDDQTCLAIELATGRTHQIRVHLAAIGHPLVGDRLYGGPPAPRLLLHALRLGFIHPSTRASIELEAPAPPAFAACSTRLRP